jgi:hypothetical protein
MVTGISEERVVSVVTHIAWKWRQRVPPESTRLHGVTCQKRVMFVVTAVRAQKLTSMDMFLFFTGEFHQLLHDWRIVV